MSGAFGSSNINTGVTFSTDKPKVELGDDTEVEESAEGYFTPNAGYIEVDGKKVVGVPCTKGFFYSASLGEKAMEVLEELASRGYAYASLSDTE